MHSDLVAQAPSNTEWQIDLVVSFWKIGTNLDIASESARQEATDKLSQGLQILRNLQEQGRLAPTYHPWIETFTKRLEAL